MLCDRSLINNHYISEFLTYLTFYRSDRDDILLKYVELILTFSNLYSKHVHLIFYFELRQ